MTMASAPRGTGPPVAIGVAVPDSTGRVGAMPQAITSSLRISAHRRALAGGGKIGGTHGKAVDIGAIERRHVDRRGDVFRQRTAERVGELARSLGTARGNNAASKRAIASSRDRMVRNWS